MITGDNANGLYLIADNAYYPLETSLIYVDSGLVYDRGARCLPYFYLSYEPETDNSQTEEENG